MEILFRQSELQRFLILMINLIPDFNLIKKNTIIVAVWDRLFLFPVLSSTDQIPQVRLTVKQAIVLVMPASHGWKSDMATIEYTNWILWLSII